MKNTKLPMLAVGMLTLGALGTIGTYAFAQTPVQDQNSNKAQTVQVTNSNKDSDVETNDDTNEVKDVVSKEVLAQVKITEVQARQIALNANPNTTIKDIQVGDEDGKAIYEIELSNGNEVNVDAANGQILQGDNDHKDGKDDQEGQDNEMGENGTETNDGPDTK